MQSARNTISAIVLSAGGMGVRDQLERMAARALKSPEEFIRNMLGRHFLGMAQNRGVGVFALWFPNKRRRISSRSFPYHLNDCCEGMSCRLSHSELPSRSSIRDGGHIQPGRTDATPERINLMRSESAKSGEESRKEHHVNWTK